MSAAKLAAIRKNAKRGANGGRPSKYDSTLGEYIMRRPLPTREHYEALDEAWYALKQSEKERLRTLYQPQWYGNSPNFRVQGFNRENPKRFYELLKKVRWIAKWQMKQWRIL